MGGDLISRSAVIKIIKDEIKLKLSYAEHNAQIDIMFKVKELPTAYDVDGVCRKINENKEMDNLIDSDHAIKIVKGGGLKRK